MRPGITEQLIFILKGLTIGAAEGFIYDLMRLIRRKLPAIWGKIMDILFAAAAAAAGFASAMQTSCGRTGIWELAAVLAGFLLYLYIISRLIGRLAYAAGNYLAVFAKKK